VRPMTINGLRGWNGLPSGDYYCEGDTQGIRIMCRESFRILQRYTFEAFHQAVNSGIFTLN
jgi:hypothetical protein